MKKEELISLIAVALEVSVNQVDEKSEMGSVEEWDSLGQLSIVTQLANSLGSDASRVSGLANCTSVKSIAENLNKAGLLE